MDGNAYPAVVDGRVKWIVDGYTTSQYFPYSQPQQLQNATVDSQTSAGRTVTLPNSSVNYIRNSVKATVDAYDGSVTLYARDDQDPLLKAWQKVFPTTIKPYSEMSGDLMSHVRYPEDLSRSSVNFWVATTSPTQTTSIRTTMPGVFRTTQRSRKQSSSRRSTCLCRCLTGRSLRSS